jgi:hypothetical protein
MVTKYRIHKAVMPCWNGHFTVFGRQLMKDQTHFRVADQRMPSMVFHCSAPRSRKFAQLPIDPLPTSRFIVTTGLYGAQKPYVRGKCIMTKGLVGVGALA